ncbi:cyclin-like protein [Pterulicium gracile]|uniref:Cyclin-like protein n=1 Tax=Pterulicium gracile TaxID=1884261 RepID=A0A5C3R0H3_9AGAR|nr:cyclin-like protein [Pterula gracilis]
MAAIPTLYCLASLSQVENTPSSQDGIPQGLEEDLRAYGCKLIQQAGILLDQKQVAVATAQILFHRFWYVSSMKQFSIGDIGMGALYLASKLEECPLRIRDFINVYDLLLQRSEHKSSSSFRYAPMSYFGSTFYDLKDAIVVSEMQILKRLGFNVSVVLPYGTLVNYMQVLGLANNKEAVSQAWGYLNDALQTPVYSIFQVPTIVSAAILLTTRHLNISLPSTRPNCWWELFDAEWDDIWIVCGFIMRLYRERDPAEMMKVVKMVNKTEVRRWLEKQQLEARNQDQNGSATTTTPG